MEINDLGYVDDYVYDLETEVGHFHAGVGSMIVKNTDSTMVDVNIPSYKECVKRGLELEADLNGTEEEILEDGTIIPAKQGLFLPPLRLEF